MLSLAFALSCVPVRAQDPGAIQGINRDANGVDASVHASVDEHPPAEPPQETSKRPTTHADSYSHWGFASHGELPNTRFWPAPPSTPPADLPAVTTQTRAKSASRASAAGGVSFRAAGQTPTSSTWLTHASDREMDPRSESNFEKVEPLLDPFHGLAAGWSRESTAQSSRLQIPVPWLPLQTETFGLPVPFRQDLFIPGDGLSSLPSPFRHITFSAPEERAEANRRKSRSRGAGKGPRAGSASGIRRERGSKAAFQGGFEVELKLSTSGPAQIHG